MKFIKSQLYQINRQKLFQITNTSLMQEAIQTFQSELKNKLEYKASSKISPDTFLYKSFKFFDLYNNGFLSKSDFFKAIAKCGVVVDTHNIDAVYNHYANTDGNVNYKQFIERLLFEQESEESNSQLLNEMEKSKLMAKSQLQKSDGFGQTSNKKQFEDKSEQGKESRIDRIYQQSETYAQVQNSIKKHLRQKGITSLLNLAVQLKSTDTSHTHKISRPKLRSKLPYLTQKGLTLILQQFSQVNGEINYAELIYALKGQLQPSQEQIIDKVFYHLDSNNERQVQIQKVVDNFKNFSYREDFIKGIKLYENFQGIDDGVFTDEDFVDFFGFLAFAFADTDRFVSFMEKSYFGEDDARSNHSQRSNRSRQFKPHTSQRQQEQPLTQQPVKQADFRKNKQQPLQIDRTPQSPNNKLQQSDKKQKSQSDIEKKSSTTSVYVKQVEMIVLRIKKRLASKGTKGFLVFERAMKNVDTDEDGLITLDQFKQVVKDLKIDITNSETTLIFDVFDPDSTNLISYSEVIHTFKGEISQKRSAYFERVWNAVKLNEEYTTFSQLKHCANFRGHPDIQTGRKYDDQIWKQIQDTILLIQELNGTARSENVTKKEFYEYFENLSITTSQDLLFESTLQNFWKMQSKVNINEMYAGSRKLFDPSAKGYLMDHHRYAVKGGSISSNAPFGTSSEPTNYFTQHSRL